MTISKDDLLIGKKDETLVSTAECVAAVNVYTYLNRPFFVLPVQNRYIFKYANASYLSPKFALFKMKNTSFCDARLQLCIEPCLFDGASAVIRSDRAHDFISFANKHRLHLLRLHKLDALILILIEILWQIK